MRACRVLLSLLIIASSVTAASAHPGRTDANGGHYNRSTGEYHYHHGYPEHQHENGICPYDFDDRTGYNSGNSGTGENLSTSSSPTTSVSRQKEPGVSVLEWIIIFVLGLSSAVMYLNLKKAKRQIKSLKTDLGKAEEEKQTIEYLKQLYNTKRIEFWQREKHEKYRKKEQYRDRRSALYAKYEGIPISNFLPVPEDVSFDEYGIPFTSGMNQDELWVYVSGKGSRYHRLGCASLPASPLKTRVWEAQTKYKPCTRCAPCSIDFSWYDDYMKLRAELARYGYVITFTEKVIHLTNRKARK